MSYCRWSSMDGKCDVYVYDDVGGGTTIHVASVKQVGEFVPCPPDFTDEEYEKWHTENYRPLGLSRDGESFNVATHEEAAQLLESLRDEGYTVPQYAIDALREEPDAD